jgi:N-acyl-D-aspartate/D-glutamate deacylase
MNSSSEALLIRGGAVVDGTGVAPFAADVRLRDGRIADVAPALTPVDGERIIDADGCYVTPGFIESHTHYDGIMWWQPDLDPLPGYGITTTVMGNCGFALAPLPDDEASRAEIVKIFSFFEDIPEAPFFRHLPWDWKTWPEYMESVRRNVRVPTNYGAYVGHIAIRLTVMGMDAWEREATDDEIERMAELLDTALAAGGLGFSTNLNDYDGDDRPVPSLHANDAEFEALIEVLARHEGATLQVILDLFRNFDAADSMERLDRLCSGKDIRIQWGDVPTQLWMKDMGLQAPLVELHDRFESEGRDYWTTYAHTPITTTLSVKLSLLFAQSNEYVWHEVVTAESDEEKAAILRDPEWRARARHSWDNEALSISPFPNPRGMFLDNSGNGAGPVDVHLGDYADELGLHCSDALAEWFLANGFESTVMMPEWEKDEPMLLRLLREPRSVGNVSDAGAHGQMLCGGGENMLLFSRYVRERGELTIEEAVHIQTGKLSSYFGFTDRGVIAPGKRADVVVFALDEVERRARKKVYDVPEGDGSHTWRWTRDPAPVRLTLVNGVATFEDGKPTGARPGEMVAPRPG